jgi:hypothetical protein
VAGVVRRRPVPGRPARQQGQPLGAGRARSQARVAENAGGARITLTDDEVARLEPIAAQVTGDRYADMAFTSAGRE